MDLYIIRLGVIFSFLHLILIASWFIVSFVSWDITLMGKDLSGTSMRLTSLFLLGMSATIATQKF